ncbi:hypothetical protein QE417_001174 [Mucilaginibacter terrae]|uniref:Uncharacterized protein n=1 Tax=Mucilaginibacter terrae TaxID=1955052 RepID=A0ABU3GQR2_9SPHI|nr:hypothetical protein [Mucilaginibacter terrae]
MLAAWEAPITSYGVKSIEMLVNKTRDKYIIN